MNLIKQEPGEIFGEYERGVEYKESIALYDTVRRNENFFNDRQWEGVNAPDLDKPVFNFLKPVVNYYIAMIVSDDIAARLDTYPAGAGDSTLLRAAEQELERVMECAKVRQKQRRMLRNAAVDGDGCFHIFFDPDAPMGPGEMGEIQVENLENTQVIFANPALDEVQSQPYLILVRTQPVEEVCARAIRQGMGKAAAEAIRADCEWDETTLYADESVTVLVKLWKENGTVRLLECTRDTLLRPAADTGCRLYPIATMSWEKVRGSCHGAAVLTGKIPNQIFVNKLYAMAMQYVKNRAFPKLLFDRGKIASWNNRLGDAIAVNGNPNEAVAASFVGADMSGQVLQLIDKTIAQTKELMGASDAALGNIRPENTSAIIAVQKAAALSLELQRMEFYQFVEDYIRIFLDMMRVRYGVRTVVLERDGAPTTVRVDFSKLGDLRLRLKVDIGAASYFSELMQVQTLDNLFLKGILTDSITYLESIPDGYLRGKNRLIAQMKAQRQAEIEQLGAQEKPKTEEE